MPAILKRLGGLVLLVAAALTALPSAHGAAQDKATIQQAKTDGLIGEAADGYLRFRVSNVPDAVRREVNTVNLERKAAYANLASKQGVSEDVVAALTAEKLISRAKVGEWVRDGNGNWIELGG